MRLDLFMGTNSFDLVTLTLGLLFESFNFVNNIWIVSAGALIFIWVFLVTELSCDKIFLLASKYFCDLGHLWNLALSGAFLFHKHILFTTAIHCVISWNIFEKSCGSKLQFSCDVLQNSVQYRISTEDIRRKRDT